MNFESLRERELQVCGYTLKIIPATIKYANEIYKIFSADVENMIFWMPNGVFESPERALISYYNRNRSLRSLMFGIFQDDKLLGEIGFSNVDERNGVCDVGYWLRKSARGKNIINKLLPRIEKLAFTQEWCHKLALHCDSENIASKTIAEKNGYVLEGIIRQQSKWPNGSLRNKLYFGKLKSDITKRDNKSKTITKNH